MQREIDHHFFRNLRIKKTSGNGYQILSGFTKLIVHHASIAKHTQSVLVSNVLNVAEKNDVECKVHKDNSSYKRKASAISKK